MHILQICYDLLSPGKDYQDLWDHLQTYKKYIKPIKPLESMWFVKTDLTAKEARDLMISENVIDGNDKLLIIDVTGDTAAWNGLSTEHSKWIRDNF